MHFSLLWSKSVLQKQYKYFFTLFHPWKKKLLPEKKMSLALQVLDRKTVQKCIELQYVGVLLLLHTGRKEKFS